MASQKLRAIYEQMDSRRYKQALKLINAQLDKKKDNAHLKVLKALAMERTGNSDAALKLAGEVKATNPIDDAVLNTLQMVYRHLGMVGEATSCFEAAWNSNPDRLDLAMQVFVAYIREEDFKKQQQLNMKLFRQYNQDKYYFAQILCTALQVKDDSGSRMLELCERQMAKAVADSRVKDCETALLYLDILKRQQKWGEIVQVVRGPLGELFGQKEDSLREQGAALMLLKRWDEARDVWLELINLDIDDWSAYSSLLDAICSANDLPVGNAEGSGSAAGWDAACKLALPILLEQQGKQTDQKRLPRAPFLAEIEVLSRRVGCTGDADVQAQLVNLIAAYVTKFGARLCCATDLVPRLSRIPSSRYPSVMETLKQIPPPEGDVSAVNARITLSRLERILGQLSLTVRSPTQLLELSQSWIEAFEAALPLNPGRLKTERSAGDDFVALAALSLLDVAEQEGSSRIMDAAVLLTMGLSASPDNFEFKLLLLRCFESLGAFGPQNDVFLRLDVKHILLDTMSYLIFDDALATAHFTHLRGLCTAAQRLDSENRRETPEYVLNAFKNGSFSKVNELVGFGRRLSNSLHLALCNAELCCIGLVERARSPEDAQEFLQQCRPSDLACSPEAVAALSDNRDMDILPPCDSIELARARADKIAERRRNDRHRLRTLALLARITEAGVVGEMSEETDGLVRELAGTLAEMGYIAPGADVSSIPAPSVSAEAPIPGLEASAWWLALQFCAGVAAMHKASAESGDLPPPTRAALDALKEVAARLPSVGESCVAALRKGGDIDVTAIRAVTTLLYRATTTLCLLLPALKSNLRPKGKGKKQQLSPNATLCRDTVEALVQGATQALETINATLDVAHAQDKPTVVWSGQLRFSSDAAAQEIAKEIAADVAASRSQTFGGVRDLVRKQLETLKGFR